MFIMDSIPKIFVFNIQLGPGSLILVDQMFLQVFFFVARNPNLLFQNGCFL